MENQREAFTRSEALAISRNFVIFCDYCLSENPARLSEWKMEILSTLTNPMFIVQTIPLNNPWLFALGGVQEILPVEQQNPLFPSALQHLRGERSKQM